MVKLKKVSSREELVALVGLDLVKMFEQKGIESKNELNVVEQWNFEMEQHGDLMEIGINLRNDLIKEKLKETTQPIRDHWQNILDYNNQSKTNQVLINIMICTITAYFIFRFIQVL